MQRLCPSPPIGAQIVIVGRCAEWTIAVAVLRIEAVIGAYIEYAESLAHGHTDNLRSGQRSGFQVQDIALCGIRSRALSGQRSIQISAAELMNTAFVFVLSADEKIVSESPFKGDR